MTNEGTKEKDEKDEKENFVFLWLKKKTQTARDQSLPKGFPPWAPIVWQKCLKTVFTERPELILSLPIRGASTHTYEQMFRELEKPSQWNSVQITLQIRLPLPDVASAFFSSWEMLPGCVTESFFTAVMTEVSSVCLCFVAESSLRKDNHDFACLRREARKLIVMHSINRQTVDLHTLKVTMPKLKLTNTIP